MDDYTETPTGWKDLPPDEIAAFMNRFSEGTLPGLLGFMLVSVSNESVLARMEIKKHHLAPNQYLHAASVIALADSTCGFATMFNLPEGAKGFTTIDMVGTINPFIGAFIIARLPLMVASEDLPLPSALTP